MRGFIIFMNVVAIVFLFSCSEMIQEGLESTEDPRVPEINVKQGSTDISSGGSYTISESQIIDISAEVVFTIENIGSADLELTGDSVILITGENADEFTVTELPDTIIEGGRNTTFSIVFSPDSVSDKSVILTIENTDFDESTYSFTITGTSQSEINVKQGSTDIVSGSGSYSIVGVKTGESSSEVVFTIENTGTFNINLTGASPVLLSGDDASEFSVAEQPDTVIAPGANSTFSIVFSPASIGDKTATITIENNDYDESSYTFTINGTTKPAPDFSARLRYGCKPMLVSFEDRSIPSGDITSWAWDFNADGIIDDTNQNPTYKYTKEGIYSVVLTVTSHGGEWYKVKAGYITVTEPEKTIVTSNLDGIETIALADINGDNMLDIAASAYLGDQIVWYENNGDTTFTQRDVDNSFAKSIAIGAVDLDEDGDVDIIGAQFLATGFVWWENVDVNPGQGDGNGLNWTEHSIGSYEKINFLIPYDMDKDNHTDILTCQANSISSEIAWWKNDGSGTLVKNSVGVDSINVMTVYPGDIDNDGDVDIAAVTGTVYNGDFSWWENPEIGGNTIWEKHIIKDDINFGSSVCAADFDGDGDLDITGTEDYGNTVYWWENVDSNGSTWNEHVLLSDAPGPEKIECTDYDDDGDIDIIAAIEYADQIALWENDGNGSFIKYDIDNSFVDVRYICVGDVDGDGKKDIVGSSFYNDTIAYWNLTFDVWPSHSVNEINFVGVKAIDSIDLDNDGDIDVLGAAVIEDDLAWWENDGEGRFTKRFIDKNYDGACDITSTDLDNDGDMDILGGASTGVSWWENTGEENFTSHEIDSATYAASVHTGDIDGDGFKDVLAAYNYYEGSIVLWKNNGDGSFNNSINIIDRLGNPTCIYTSDIDGDADLDVVSSSTDSSGYTENICWFENDNGTGDSWTTHVIDYTFEGASSVYPVDIDNDGDIDLLATANVDNLVVWYENDDVFGPGTGNGSSFTIHEIENNFIGASSVYAIDLNNDGTKDVIASAKDDNMVSLWYNEGNGVFGMMEIIGTDFTGAISVKASDIDTDGDFDIIGAANTDDDIFWWENNIIKYGN
ncbi:MAG: FG-GAP-like repeat-containing protein [Spirochaetota bacterium]|nr:FG-GAP-like repeat-containing protein [Spirochaetota bacterium]